MKRSLLEAKLLSEYEEQLKDLTDLELHMEAHVCPECGNYISWALFGRPAVYYWSCSRCSWKVPKEEVSN